MSFIQRILEALDARLWKFIRIVHSSNHDYPYHDYVSIGNIEGQDILKGSYAVGTSNVDAHGDQSKRFVSKHANIWSEMGGSTIRFNDSRNVEIDLPLTYINAAETLSVFQKQFYTNVAVVYYSIPVGAVLHMYFEGVLPEETRDAE